jgi:hypothetical protein
LLYGKSQFVNVVKEDGGKAETLNDYTDTEI